MTERALIKKLEDLEAYLAANNVILDGCDEGAYVTAMEAVTEIAAMASAIDRQAERLEALERVVDGRGNRIAYLDGLLEARARKIAELGAERDTAQERLATASEFTTRLQTRNMERAARIADLEERIEELDKTAADVAAQEAAINALTERIAALERDHGGGA